MSGLDPVIDVAFREYADLELRRHRLLLAGNEDSPELAKIEDRMERLWMKLDDVQRRSLSGMASDLNWIRRKGEPPPKGRKTPEAVAATEQQELLAAMKSKEWHRILHYLRLCAPSFQVASLARERGIAYDAIGFPDYATIFHTHAIEFARTNATVVAKANAPIVRRSYATISYEQAIKCNRINSPVVAVATSSAQAGNWLYCAEQPPRPS